MFSTHGSISMVFVKTLFFRGFGSFEQEKEKKDKQKRMIFGLVLDWQNSRNFVFLFKNFCFIHMTMTIILCDYPCARDILDIVWNGSVTNSTNGSSHNNAR